MTNNQTVVSLKGVGTGPASEWLTIHAEDPNYLTQILDAVIAGGLGEKVADAAVVFRAVTAAKAGTSPAAQAPAAQAAPAPAVAQAYQPTPDPETTHPQAPAANPWGQSAQAPAQPAPQAYAPAPQQQAQAYAPAPAQAQQWAQPGAQPAAPAFNPPPPGPAPMGSDGYPMVWKVGQPTTEKQGYGAWMSGAPRNHPNRAKAIFVVNTPKLGG